MRYETAVPIGEGATGRVMKAWDPVLKRHVALKVLRHDDPEIAERMLREARVQARIDHPNVCRIYDVGELDGRPFISMQLIEGTTLGEVGSELTVEEKVHLLAKVADAVQAAHSAGLVHRDLKPSNILVERNETGRLEPFVVDFGIARERHAVGLTLTGQMIGTPAYMSPEQARGEVTTLDRRSDVFSLGIVAYELLAGVHPFQPRWRLATGETGAAKQGSSTTSSDAELLLGILDREPRRLRETAPHLSVDLQTIVATCLDKDPERRYPSALALSEDLGRYLDGEPIRARPIGLVRRFGRRLRRHPWTSAALAAALIAVAGAGLWALQVRSRAAERARLAERFGEGVERMRTSLRLAYMLPLHDIRSARRGVLDQLAAIDAERERIGDVAEGPSRLAMGMGYLSLGRIEDARRELDASWNSGYRTASVALALGEVLAEQYFRGLRRAQAVVEPESREAERQRLRSTYGDRARDLLTSSMGSDLRPYEQAHVSGLLALYEGRYDQALEYAEEAAGAREWFYDAHLIAAAARRGIAAEQSRQGRFGDAISELGAALREVDEAARKAPSDPLVHLRGCELEIARIAGLEDLARPPDPAAEAAIERCDRALVADSGLAAARNAKAEALWRWGGAMHRRGEDGGPLLDAALVSVALTAESSEDRSDAYMQRARVLEQQGQITADRGETAERLLAASIEAFERALELDPTQQAAARGLGTALARWGDRRAATGGDPLPLWNRAEEILSASIASAEAPDGIAYRLYCSLLTERAYWELERHRDPAASLGRGEEVCERAVALRPQSQPARNNLGMYWWTRADWEARRELDADRAYARAAAAFEQVLDKQPDRASTNVNLANLLQERAAWRLRSNRETLGVEEMLRRATGLIDRVREVYPDDYNLIRGKIELVRALSPQGDAGPAEAFERALAYADRARELQPSQTAPLSLRVQILCERSRWLSEKSPLPAASLAASVEQAERAVADALALEPELGDVLAHRLHLEALRQKAAKRPAA